MGTINYGTSDYITVGYNCDGIDYDDNYYYEFVQDDYDQVIWTRKNYTFYYFDVTVKPGYYEGFYINIEHNYSYCYDSAEEKRLALKEITQIKRFLLECINDFCLCSVYPGWCMRYADRAKTLEDLNAAIKEMRDDVKATPTWATLRRMEATT